MLASWVCWGRRCSLRLASEPPAPGALSEKRSIFRCGVLLLRARRSFPSASARHLPGGEGAAMMHV
jgi:hypothetical protein